MGTTEADPGVVTDALFAGLAARLDRVTREITAGIRTEIPGYAALAADEHGADVDLQIRNVVRGLISGTGPTPGAIEHARGVGHRRAASGMTLPDVIEAYHIAYREIWNELLIDAQQAEPPLGSVLPSVVSLLWLWFHRLSAAVAEGHAAETEARRGDLLERERELMDQLTGRVPADDVVATELGYQADGEFTVACAAGLGRRDAADRLAESLRKTSRRVTCIYHEGHVVVVAQGLAVDQICTAVDAIRPTARLGIGIPRAGLAGAASSLQDARDALQRTSEIRRVVEFADDWLMSSLNAIRPRFEGILQPTMVVARQQPDLAETVRAYSECRYSVSACARRMHIHPNTARYRLDRWKALTGHDVETLAGLAASVTALELAR
jgi:DNA-binding PucR family transcriptional regulator